MEFEIISCKIIINEFLYICIIIKNKLKTAKFMKKSLLTLLSVIVAGFSFAQSFTLQDVDGNDITSQTIVLDSAEMVVVAIAHVHVVNTSGESIDAKVKREVLQDVSGSHNSFCWDVCYTANVNVAVNSLAIGAGDTFEGFTGDYYAEGNPGVAKVRYIFFDINDLTDTAYVDVEYHVQASTAINDIQTSFSADVYPNPANDYATINYSAPPASYGYLAIFNVIGVEVKRIPLNKNKGQVRVDTYNLSSGVYFCNFILDGKMKKTTKLVVSH